LLRLLEDRDGSAGLRRTVQRVLPAPSSLNDARRFVPADAELIVRLQVSDLLSCRFYRDFRRITTPGGIPGIGFSEAEADQFIKLLLGVGLYDVEWVVGFGSGAAEGVAFLGLRRSVTAESLEEQWRTPAAFMEPWTEKKTGGVTWFLRGNVAIGVMDREKGILFLGTEKQVEALLARGIPAKPPESIPAWPEEQPPGAYLAANAFMPDENGKMREGFATCVFGPDHVTITSDSEEKAPWGMLTLSWPMFLSSVNVPPEFAMDIKNTTYEAPAGDRVKRRTRWTTTIGPIQLYHLLQAAPLLKEKLGP
jgi:hypothetical protein